MIVTDLLDVDIDRTAGRLRAQFEESAARVAEWEPSDCPPVVPYVRPEFNRSWFRRR